MHIELIYVQCCTHTYELTHKIYISISIYITKPIKIHVTRMFVLCACIWPSDKRLMLENKCFRFELLINAVIFKFSDSCLQKIGLLCEIYITFCTSSAYPIH